MKIVFIGLTISSSWGNGHATTYRGLLRELAAMGHEVYFLEPDRPWYSSTRDFDRADDYRLEFFDSTDTLKRDFKALIQLADMVIVGSFVPDGIAVCHWVLQTAQGMTAFYDIDTPVTLHKLDEGNAEYIDLSLIPQFDIYLSFSGGNVLRILEKKYKATKARALYCSVDPEHYYPMELEKDWLLGYLGTYSDDRQGTLQNLLITPSLKMHWERFVVAGPGYPEENTWPENVKRIDHLAPHLHREFYNRQKFTLNVTRQAMIRLGYSPSVRLFEAAACGVPIISDYWEGLSDLLEPGKEVYIARGGNDMEAILLDTTMEERKAVGEAARRKVMNSHTSAHRALELISYYQDEKKDLVRNRVS